MTLTGFALRKYTTVYVFIVLITIMGLVSYFTLPREAAPDVNIPFMIITTIYSGVSPEDIETLITREIEKELKNLKDVKEITSNSSESVSVIAIEFNPDVDLDFALQRVKDKVDKAKPNLPDEAEEPTVTEIDFENMPIINVVLTADYDLVKLKEVADDLSDEIETIQGVLEAKVNGALEREVQINVDPERLKDYNLGLGDITKTIMEEHVTIPGGNIDIGDNSYTVRVPGEIKNPYTFNDLVVTATSQGPVYIRDIAEVQYGFKDRTSIARLDGKPSISVSVTKRTGENIIHIADGVKEILKRREPSLPKGTHITVQGDMSKFIRVMVADLENNIFNGFILVMLCIFLFLGFTNSIFVAISIPFSMLISFIVLDLMGISLNFIVLFSLIMALGMLVDNAIVIVENIYRHRHTGKDALRGSEEATNEVAMAVTTSTLTTVCAFAPIIFWPGIMGEFMKYLPITVIITLLSSLFVAIFINPVLCYRFMKVKDDATDSNGKGLFKLVLGQYERLLTRAVTHPKITLGISFLILIITIGVYSVAGLGVELFPNSDPDSMYIDIKAPVGTRIETTDAIARQLEKTCAEFPDIENILTNVGVSTSSSGLAPGFDTSNEGRIYMDFVDFEKRSQPSLKTFNESVNKIKYITGAEVKLDKEENGPPVGEPVEIQISGDDFLLLGDLAKDIRNTIKDIPGLVDLKDDFESSKPEIRLVVDREKAAMLGISTMSVALAVRNAINGFDAGDFREKDEDYDITVRFAKQDRSSIPDLDKIFIFDEGKQIPLSSVAEFKPAAGFGSIRRADLKRVVTITGSNHGRLANDILTDVKAKLASYKLPSGYDIKYRGEDEASQEAGQFLVKAFVIAIFLIALVLVTQFDSLVLPFIIMTSVILSLIGVFWGLMISQLPFGIIMTGVGVISLAGVVVNNAIVLLDYTMKLRFWGRSKLEAVIEAGKTRFRPVLLTAITTIVGLIPLATGWAIDIHTFRFVAGGSSSQWWAPMAVAVIYGLTVATLLTLVVVPSMYMILGRSDQYFRDRQNK
ncbi:efflux RND transporter permease subunit [bacterium]|nr:efflux RND transporter permease subunit [bacterium]